jgi:alkylation response protein AidB-like acyl-CoA dehydrogenase
MEAGMAKLFASETAMEIALNAVRIHGANPSNQRWSVRAKIGAEISEFRVLPYSSRREWTTATSNLPQASRSLTEP